MKILLIDDEALLLQEVAAILSESGHVCRCSSNGKAGLEEALRFLPDVVLCDLTMPELNGLQVLRQLRKELPQTEVVIITAFGSMESAISAFREGACDYLLKPIIFEDILNKLGRIASHRALLAEVRELRQKVSHQCGPTTIVGRSPRMQEVGDLAGQLSSVPSSVLLVGETGTGKEVIARAIHEGGERGSKPFIAVNCAAVPDSLMESELFGYARGAFTGAMHDKVGLIEAANGGTLLLDEFCEMPPALQSKLLRVLERKEITRIGNTRPISVDVRILAATNCDPLAYMEQGKLREDLYYRIRVMEIHLPPLRERKEDIPLLAQHFIEIFNQEMKRTVAGLSNAALQAMMLYFWPGNVRELKNAIERAMIFTTSGFLPLEAFPAEISRKMDGQEVPDELRIAMKAYESAHILNVLQRSEGNRARASELLGVDRSTLHRKLATMPEALVEQDDKTGDSKGTA